MAIAKALTTKYQGIANCLMNDVFVCNQEVDIYKTKNIDACKQYKAIWDTGATNSVITRRVVEECNLCPTGTTFVTTVSGKEMSNKYALDLVLPGNVVIGNLEVTEGNFIGADVLIGMDVIRMGDFAVSNYQGKTIFTYRIPSLQQIDFLAGAKKNNPIRKSISKQGRNELCACGSGKKYKNCCGK